LPLEASREIEEHLGLDRKSGGDRRTARVPIAGGSTGCLRFWVADRGFTSKENRRYLAAGRVAGCSASRSRILGGSAVEARRVADVAVLPC
jgi:hypothetical protein